MRKLITILKTVAFLLCTSQLTAQVILSTPDFVVDPGESFEVPVSVKNFNEIVSIQFATKWNPNILQFDSIVHEFVLDDMVAENYDPSDPTDPSKDGVEDQFGAMTAGELRFSWFQQSTTGQSLPDDAVLFTIVFTVVGGDGTSTPVNLGPLSGFPVEFINKEEEEVSVTFENGMTVVGMVNTTSEVNNPDFQLNQNQPNPFNNETIISFELKKNIEADFFIYDLNGKTIFADKNNYNSGKHQIRLQKSMFPAAGTYFYQFKTTDYIATRKLVVLN